MLGMQSDVELLPRGYGEMFGGVENLKNDRLYGTELEVEYELFDGSQSLGTVTELFHVYRWVDAIGANKVFKTEGAISAFHEKLDKGVGKFITDKEIEFFLPESSETAFTSSDPDLQVPSVLKGTRKAKWKFEKSLPIVQDKVHIGGDIKLSLAGIGDSNIGTIAAKGDGQVLISRNERNFTIENSDNGVEIAMLPPNFKFYGQEYDTMFVYTNGYVTFGTITNPIAFQNPNGFPEGVPMIAPFWANTNLLNDQEGGDFKGKVIGIETPRTGEVKVTWQDVAYNPNEANPKRNTFSMTIKANSVVEFSYDKIEWTSGKEMDGASGGFGGKGALVGFSGGQPDQYLVLGQPGWIDPDVQRLPSSFHETYNQQLVPFNDGNSDNVPDNTPVTATFQLNHKGYPVRTDDYLKVRAYDGPLKVVSGFQEGFFEDMYNYIKNEETLGVDGNGNPIKLRPEVGLLLMAVAVTESDGGRWLYNNNPGAGYWGAFQIDRDEVARKGSNFGAFFESNNGEITNNGKIEQLRVAQLLYDQKKAEIEPTQLASDDAKYTYLEPFGQPVSQFLPQQAELYQVAYSWLSKAGIDSNKVRSWDYASAALHNAQSIMKRVQEDHPNLEGGWSKLVDEIFNNEVYNGDFYFG